MKQENTKGGVTTDLSSLQPSQILYMKRIEKENYDRVMRLKKMRKNNMITGFGLTGAILGIYFYSIFSVKQESFLDDLDEKK